jgi:low temperature requirement protein LtrA
MLDELTPTQQELEVETEQEVTALELFFDLVFVFAITQVTGFLYHDPSWTGLVKAVAILMALWFTWSAYSLRQTGTAEWKGNDERQRKATCAVPASEPRQGAHDFY